MQVVSAVDAMQAAGHNKPWYRHIVPALAKNARTGHPEFGNGKRKKSETEGRATRLGGVAAPKGLSRIEEILENRRCCLFIRLTNRVRIRDLFVCYISQS